MKKQLVIAAGLAVLSTSAYATKARMEALGQDGERGSLLFEDSRDVFHNPAHVNDMKNYVVLETGTALAGTNEDSAATPEAEGGWYGEAGSFAYGVYLNGKRDDVEIHDDNTGDVSVLTGSTVSGRTNYAEVGNQVDIFIGGDAGMQWGVNVNLSSFKNEVAQQEQSGMGVGLGVVMGDMEAYANLGIKDESEGGLATGDKWEADMGINVGGAYKLGDYTLQLDYRTGGHTDTVSSVATERSATEITVGLGRIMETTAGKWFYNLGFYKNASEIKTGSTTIENDSNRIPLTVGFEADATSWLTLRGSASQSLRGSGESSALGSGKKIQSANTTSVATGATLNFGKLKVDGSIVTQATGTWNFDTLSRVSLHYWF